jgi:hypothetical protein
MQPWWIWLRHTRIVLQYLPRIHCMNTDDRVDTLLALLAKLGLLDMKVQKAA